MTVAEPRPMERIAQPSFTTTGPGPGHQCVAPTLWLSGNSTSSDVPAAGALCSLMEPPQAVVVGLDPDGHVRRLPVLGRVRERLGHDVVRRDLDRLGEAAVRLHLQLHRHGGLAGQHVQRRVKSLPGQDRGVDAPREVA
jgi:hypothetical protein